MNRSNSTSYHVNPIGLDVRATFCLPFNVHLKRPQTRHMRCYRGQHRSVSPSAVVSPFRAFAQAAGDANRGPAPRLAEEQESEVAKHDQPQPEKRTAKQPGRVSVGTVGRLQTVWATDYDGTSPL